MRICLVRPATFTADFTYPYNIDCIASVLRRDGHMVTFVDAEVMASRALQELTAKSRFEKLTDRILFSRKINKQQKVVDSLFDEEGITLWKDIAKKILSSNPDFVGFSCYSASMSSTCRIVKHLREDFKYDNSIVLGGIHPSSVKEEVFERMPEVNCLVVGEGEETVVELARALECGTDLGRVKGICFNNNGGPRFTGPRPLIEDLSRLPVSRFDLGEPGQYSNHVILTSRGCPFHCDYCASKVVFEKRVRFRPPELIGQEIENLVERTGTRSLRFGDDTFTVNLKHMQGIHSELKRRNVSLSLSIGSRIDTINEEKLALLKDMGVNHISFGIESGSERIQRRVHKNLKLEEVVSKIRMINDAGIFTLTFFILNHPDETAEDMEASLLLIKEMSKRCRLNYFEINTGIPYPETPWWDFAEKKGLLKDIDFYLHSHQYNHQLAPVVNMTSEPSTELLRYYKKMHRIEVMKRFFYLVNSIFKNPSKMWQVLRQTIRA